MAFQRDETEQDMYNLINKALENGASWEDIDAATGGRASEFMTPPKPAASPSAYVNSLLADYLTPEQAPQAQPQGQMPMRMPQGIDMSSIPARMPEVQQTSAPQQMQTAQQFHQQARPQQPPGLLSEIDMSSMPDRWTPSGSKDSLRKAESLYNGREGGLLTDLTSEYEPELEGATWLERLMAGDSGMDYSKPPEISMQPAQAESLASLMGSRRQQRQKKEQYTPQFGQYMQSLLG